METGRPGGKAGEVKGIRRAGIWELALRVAALGLTLVAAVVLRTDDQNTTFVLQVSPVLPRLNIPVTAKWHYLSSFLYFVVANAVACAYAALSLLLLLILRRGGGKAADMVTALITISDVMMVALLFSSCGATTAVGILGREGNSHVKWGKVCNVFGRFCHRVSIALSLSFIGSFGFFLLAALAVVGLHRRP
ncbi:hypothetical protein SAY86_027883 [Trapa natans]|uniref:CASP-like protein n=1 Tax=Trapa natans TaxID=22666 RepID=A0AAN7RA79_TRANT|nr:hypothetical protein SAY86_027883 [Trapa natans]